MYVTMCLFVQACVFCTPVWAADQTVYEEEYRYREAEGEFKIKDGLKYHVEKGEAVIDELLLKEREVHIPEMIGDDIDASVRYPVVKMDDVYLPKSVETLYLPKTLREYTVNNAVFGKGCSFKSIIVEQGNKCLSSKEGILYSRNGRELIYCPPNRQTKVRIPGTVKKIKEYAFAGLKTKRLAIPDTVTEIERGAFYCAKVKNVKLPQNLKRISEGLFQGCWSLKEIKIPSAVRTIESSAFFGIHLRAVIFARESRLEHIGEAAFASNGDLKQADLPDSIRRIEKSAFYGCVNLKSVRLPEGLKSIDYRAFGNCFALKEIEIPGTVEWIGMEAFCRCRILRKITVHGSGLKEIQKRAFHDIGNKKKITFAAQENSYAYRYAKKQGFCVRAL